METNNYTFHDIYKSRQTLVSQLKRAGYNTASVENVTSDELHYMNMHNDLDFKVDNGDKKAIIKYFMNKTIKAKVIQEMTSELFEPDNVFIPDKCVIILISDTEPNASLQDLVKQIFAEEKIQIIIYNFKRLLFDVLDHVMVPKHTILTDVERAKFIEDFNIADDSNIPSISRFDPVAQAIFMRPGEICKITRASVNSIEGYYYRLCVNV